MVFGPRSPGGPGGPGGLFGQPSFATHPFARSPRDFFMAYDAVSGGSATQVPFYSMGYAASAVYQAGP
jgi:hypothetical protein